MTLPTDGFMGAGASVMYTVAEVSDNDQVFVIQIIGLCNIKASLREIKDTMNLSTI